MDSTASSMGMIGILLVGVMVVGLVAYFMIKKSEDRDS